MWLLAAASLLIIAALLIVYLVSNNSKASNTSGGHYRFAVGQPGPGAQAPAVVLPSTAGGTFDLKASAGKTVLLYFQEGVGCQPCWTQMRDIEKNWSQFTAAGVDQFVTITSDSLDLISRKIKQDGITHGAGVPTAAVTSVRLNRQDSGGRFDPFRRFHLDR